MNGESSTVPLRERIFPLDAEKRFFSIYRRAFSVGEFERTPELYPVLWVFLLTFLVTFLGWIHSPALTVEQFILGKHLCWPYFQNCGEWYVLHTLPYGYSQPILYMGFFALMVFAAYTLWKKEFVLAHGSLLILWTWKVLTVLVFTKQHAGNFEYYDIIIGAALLLFPYKWFFARLYFVLLYFLASTIKIHEGWILGTYFTSLYAGLPIFPDSIAPIITNTVIGMQVVGAWFLFSNRPAIQRSILAYFILFHLYSGILVGYRYPISALGYLLVLFAPVSPEKIRIPIDKKSVAGWCFVMILFVLQSLAFIIPGDQKITLEGNMYGLYMFEANHQCRSTTKRIYSDGRTEERITDHTNARDRCDPYDTWFRLKQQCTRNMDIARIEWTFDHSINGGPFYRIVSVQNACDLQYHAFGHNEWIKDDTVAEVMGHPLKNYYR